MQNTFRMGRLATLAIAVLFAATVTRAQGHEHGQMQGPAEGKEQALKVGKNGKIELSEETKVGDLTLRPGPYKVQHRVGGSDHFIHFIQLTKPIPYKTGSGDTPKSHPGEVMCKIEPLNEEVTQTAVYLNKEDGMMRITRIEISGENVAHLF